MCYDVYTGLLKAFPLRKEENTQIRFSYACSDAGFEKLKKAYPIETVAGTGTDFEKAVNMLVWVSKHIYHKGNFNLDIPYNALDLLEYAYDKDSEHGLSCVALATVLSGCLLAIGLKARRVLIQPCSPYDGDSHAVTQVFISEMNKWVMLDPTYCAYLTNERKEPLSLVELRACLANQKPVFFSAEAEYNGMKWTEEEEKAGIEYFAKNLFYMQTTENSAFLDTDATGCAAGNRVITLSPDGYDVRQNRLSNIEYRIKQYGSFRQAEKWMDRVRNEPCVYCSAQDFERVPVLE